MRYYNFLSLFLLNDFSLGFLSTQRPTLTPQIPAPLPLQPSNPFPPLPVLTSGPSRDRGATLSCLLPGVMHINQAPRCQITSNQEHTKAQQEVIIGSVRASFSHPHELLHTFSGQPRWTGAFLSTQEHTLQGRDSL